jgi:putative transposase
MSFQEIADAKLPCLPTAKRAVAKVAAREDWLSRRDRNGRPLWRERAGRGGGKEWHVSLLPVMAQVKLAGVLPTDAGSDQVLEDEDNLDSDLMDEFARLPAKTRKIAAWRLSVIDHVNELTAGNGKADAVNQAAREAGVSFSTVWNWLDLIKARSRFVRIALLAPKTKGKPPKAAIEPDAWKWFISYYLRPGPITFEEAAYRTNKEGAKSGWAKLPCTKTLIRRFNATVPRHVAVLRKEGPEGLARLTPALERTRGHFVAGQCVVADGHKWDVACEDDAGKPCRLMTLAIQDLYSGKILAWRHALSESSHLVQLAFHDLVRDYGAPEHVYLDNGMGFAAKCMTGGCNWRYRGKVKHDELTGLLPQIGAQVHWARPAHGQAKPIERAFKDMATRIPTLPRFHGAYLGNRPTEKPFNYGERRIPVAELMACIDEEIADHNSRTGRRSEVCGGVMSFDQAFAKSYETAVVYKLSGAALAPFLMQAAEHMVRLDGTVHLFGSRYHHDDLRDWAGKRVLVRFDPDDLAKPVLVQTREGAMICEAEALGKVAFDDASGARKQYAKTKELLARGRQDVLDGLITAEDLAARMQERQEALEYGDDDDLEPAAIAIRPVTNRARGGVAAKVAQADAFDPMLDYFTRQTEARGSHLRIVHSDDEDS